MKQTSYRVVTSDGQRVSHDVAFFEHESETRTYARAAAQGGRRAYVLKVETEFLDFYAPETPSEAKRSGETQ